MSIHICLVSSQLLANYIPILMDKPTLVYVISTQTMQKNGMTKRFCAMLDVKNIPYHCYDEMPSTNMPKIHEYALTISDEIIKKHQGEHLVLNLTGGTKLMSQGFTDIIENDAQLIYTDTQYGVLEYLGNNKKAPLPLKSVLGIEDYFSAYGANFKRADSDDDSFQQKVAQRKSVTKEIGNNISQISPLISNLNYLVHQKAMIKGELIQPDQHLNKTPLGKWADVLHSLNKENILTWNSGLKIQFVNEETARYLSGIWLEEYVYHIAKDANPEHVKCGVKISWQHSQKTHNELDIVLVHNNKMLIIECKTSRFKANTSSANMLYKIDSLGDDLKGLYGEVWLVSAQVTSPEMKDRAKDRQIKMIEGDNIKALRSDILNWMHA